MILGTFISSFASLSLAMQKQMIEKSILRNYKIINSSAHNNRLILQLLIEYQKFI